MLANQEIRVHQHELRIVWLLFRYSFEVFQGKPGFTERLQRIQALQFHGRREWSFAFEVVDSLDDFAMLLIASQ